jgi:hypothetical protein
MITLLLRCYPARWRARYGDEFAAVLEERPLGPFDVADVLLGALDAHLHLRGLGAASQHAKGFAMSLRIGGYAAVLGGLLWFIVLVSNAINDGAESGAYWIGIVLVVAVVATLVALVGLSAFQARRYPMLTWAAFAVPAVGGLVSLLGAVAITINGDSDRAIVGGLSGWAISTLGVLALLVGSGLFALATWRTRTLSRPASALLAVGALVVVPGLAGLSGSLVPAELMWLAVVVTILTFPAGWVAMGISALRVGRPATSLEGALL